MDLLVEITHCPIAEAIFANPALINPCKEIVLSQGVEKIYDFQVPEPWSGQIKSAPLLFLSSNPSISMGEQYPLWSWSEDARRDFFSNRFGTGRKLWVCEGKSSLQKDGTYSKPVAFWAFVKRRAVELFKRDAIPGVDYALSEVVHCKSLREFGVKAALTQCTERYLEKVIAESRAVIVVVLGSIAKYAMTSIYNLSGDQEPLKPVSLAGRKRYVVCLPHPNARKPRTFKVVLSEPVLKRLQELLCTGINSC